MDPNSKPIECYQDLDLETIKFLHKHTYERIMWYRDEIWRVATPVWAGFGALLIAVLTTAISLRKEAIPDLTAILSGGTLVASLLINVLFYGYVGRLYESVDKLNTLMSERELSLSKRADLFQKVAGYYEKDHVYVQHKVFPGLDLLFVLSNIILTLAIVGIIHFVVPPAPLNNPIIQSKTDKNVPYPAAQSLGPDVPQGEKPIAVIRKGSQKKSHAKDKTPGEASP